MKKEKDLFFSGIMLLNFIANLGFTEDVLYGEF